MEVPDIWPVTTTALQKACLKYGILGHFRNQCRIKQTQKRKLEGEESSNSQGIKKKNRTTNNIEETANISTDERKVDYFSISRTTQGSHVT